MSGLPFLRLPQLVQSIALRQVEVIDLITLSFCSRKVKKLVRSANVQIDVLTLDLRSAEFSIEVNNVFSLEYSSQAGSVYLKDSENQEFPLFRTSDTAESVTSHVIGHLFETFIRIETVKVNSYLPSLLDHSLWNYRKEIDDLVVFSFPEDNTQKMSVAEMKLIFEELTVKRLLHIHRAVDAGYQHSEGFSQDKVKIYNGEWVNFEAWLNCKCTCISLNDVSTPTSTQMNTILKLWLAKEKFENLMILSVGVKTGEAFADGLLAEVLDSIQHETVRGITRIRRVDGKPGYVGLSEKYFSFAVIDI